MPPLIIFLYTASTYDSCSNCHGRCSSSCYVACDENCFIGNDCSAGCIAPSCKGNANQCRACGGAAECSYGALCSNFCFGLATIVFI